MTRTQRDAVEALFDELADLPERDRAARLSACDDNEVRDEVRRLLEGTHQDFHVTAFRESFDQLAGELEADLPARTVVDQFELIEKVGEGGMGAVYRATQQMTNRVVALKLIRPNLLSPQLVRRFLFEVEVLGKLNHPSIARVFAAGIATITGRSSPQPFFAMEWIDGVPLDRYIAETAPPRRERLQLLRRIADAVDHAHSRGVVHRDLKPANVIVQSDGMPKVVDFGVACATAGERGGAGRITELDNAIIGTFAYMAPEQLLGKRDQFDPDTDVYSLGVVGYEVLVGHRPHEFKGLSVYEATRSVCENDPKPPSHTDPLLRGDVDAVLMKAMDRDKSRRYPTARGLADDLGRILDYEPVSARQQTRAYRLSRFVRRNRNSVAAAALVATLLIAGATGTTIGLVREARARKSAEAERDALSTVLRFVNEDLLGAADPANSGGRDVTVREIVDAASSSVGTRFANQPEVERSVRTLLGGSYTAMGRSAEALPHAKAAMDLSRRVHGEHARETMLAEMDYASALRALGRATEAEPLLRELVRRATRAFGADDELVLQGNEAHGRLLESLGRAEEAVASFKLALDASIKLRGPDDRRTILSSVNYAGGLVDLNKLTEAEPLYADAVRRFDKMSGRDHPETLGILNNWAYALRNLGRIKEAEPVYRDLLTRVRRVLSDDHPNTITVAGNVASLLFDLEKFDEAEAAYRSVLEQRIRVQGADHPETIRQLHNLAYFYSRRGRFAEAEPLHREAVERAIAAPDIGVDNGFTRVAVEMWARCLQKLERPVEAAAARAKLPATMPSTTLPSPPASPPP